MIQALLDFGAKIPPALNIGGVEAPIVWKRNPKARRYILRFKRPYVVATIPRGGSKREAWAFIQRSRSWLQRQMTKPVKTPVVWGQGTEVWFRGEKFALELNCETARLGNESVQLNADLKTSVCRHFHRIACAELPARTLELANRVRLEIARVTVRNQRSRWGSCSVRRTISLNWRLIQTPSFVVDYIILHELMHLRQMNHSKRFWVEVEKVCPGWRDAEAWIRKHGREILPG